jgi:hypothetical protein
MYKKVALFILNRFEWGGYGLILEPVDWSIILICKMVYNLSWLLMVFNCLFFQVQKIQNLTPNIGVVYRFVSACFSVIRKFHFFLACVSLALTIANISVINDCSGQVCGFKALFMFGGKLYSFCCCYSVLISVKFDLGW